MDNQHASCSSLGLSPFSSSDTSIMTLSIGSDAMHAALDALKRCDSDPSPSRESVLQLDLAEQSITGSYSRQRSRIKTTLYSSAGSEPVSRFAINVCEIHGLVRDCWNQVTKQAVCRSCSHVGTIESAFKAHSVVVREHEKSLCSSISTLNHELVDIRDRKLLLRRESLALQRCVHEEMQRWMKRIRDAEDSESRLLDSECLQLEGSKLEFENELKTISRIDACLSVESMLDFLQLDFVQPTSNPDPIGCSRSIVKESGLFTLKHEWQGRQTDGSETGNHPPTADSLEPELQRRLCNALSGKGLGSSSLTELGICELSNVLESSGVFTSSEIDQILVSTERSRLFAYRL